MPASLRPSTGRARRTSAAAGSPGRATTPAPAAGLQTWVTRRRHAADRDHADPSRRAAASACRGGLRLLQGGLYPIPRQPGPGTASWTCAARTGGAADRSGARPCAGRLRRRSGSDCLARSSGRAKRVLSFPSGWRAGGTAHAPDLFVEGVEKGSPGRRQGRACRTRSCWRRCAYRSAASRPSPWQERHCI